MNLFDAHNHLQDERLADHQRDIFPLLSELGVARAVVNGTRPSDWPAVAALAKVHSWILPSFGLHPWHVPTRPATWQEELLAQLDAHPQAGLGEIGLDRWIQGHDLADQTTVFNAQLTLATDRNLPPTIHCLQAWGTLWDILRTQPLPERGFLLHAYGGPMELMAGLVARGAYFSFSPYFLHPRKGAQRAVFAAIPEERLLVETDAPDLRPPDERDRHPLSDPAGHPLNHPANLEVAYAGLAEIRGWPTERLAALVAENFGRLFGA